MKFLKRLIMVFVVLWAFVWLVSLFSPRSPKIEYGVTFSYPYAQSLGLDWQKSFLAMLDDLKPKYVRLSAYWDSTEPRQGEYDFGALDFQMKEAANHNTKAVMTVGRRLPRWPECHDPGWIQNLSKSSITTAQLSFVETITRRYQNYPNLFAWQVENEPFLSTFGICPPLDTSLLDSEIALVKKIDPSRPVIITDSGELNWWFKATARGDIFGTTFYRYVFSDVLKRYWTNFYFVPIVYRFKAGLIELLAEPWTTKGITGTPIDEQFKTMGMDHFNTIVSYARATGFSPQYLWGVEWWYWMKDHGHPEFWERARELFNE
jgi:Beta-galactosidase